MMRPSIIKPAVAAAGVLLAAALAAAPLSSARAEDFFFRLFGGQSAPPPPPIRMPFADDGPPPRHEAPRPHLAYDRGQAFCVRACDGRYFPAQGSDNESRAKSCQSFCPASATTLVFGSNIDEATTQGGKSYSDLPNAFRYRKELVAGCSCNGKDSVGLAAVEIGDDPTLRKGDIVADSDGLVVASRNASDRHAMNFSPLSDKQIRARFHHLPVVAKD